MLSSLFRLEILAALLIDPSAAFPFSPSSPAHSTNKTHWTRHESIGLGPRQEHGVAGLDDQIFIIGGVHYDNNGAVETINRVESYTRNDQKWHVAAPLPLPVNHPNVAAVNGNIYLTGSLSAGSNWTALSNTYAYTPANDTWAPLASMPAGTARGSSVVGVYSNTIYLAGGQPFLELVPPYRQPGVDLVSSYNTLTNSWDTTSLPPLPQVRQHASGAVVGSVFYVVGGREFSVGSFHDTVFALDLENLADGWKTMAAMPTARGSLACAALDTIIYCFGGEGNPSNDNEIFGQVEAYDTVHDSWSVLPDMEVPRHGMGALAMDGNIWIPGGGVKTAMAPVGIVDSLDFA